MGRGKSADPGTRLVGYARVSTEDQSLALQLDALDRAGVLPDNLHVDHRSGASVKRREGLLNALKDCREGDTLVVWRLDRLTRSIPDLYWIIAEIERKGAGFLSLTENIDKATPSGRFMLNVMTAFAQFERESIAQRTKAGLAVIKRLRGKGWRWGPKPKMTPAKIARAGRLLNGGMSGPKVAAKMNVSTASIYGFWKWSSAKGRWIRKSKTKPKAK